MSPRPRSRVSRYVGLAGFLAAVALIGPRLANSGQSANLLNLWLVYSVAGIGFYWIFGLAGRFAFCQTSMMAFGGYVTAWTSGRGWPFWASISAAVIATACVSALVALAVRRSTEFYFAIATLAVTQVGLLLFSRTSSFTGLNGAVSGISYPSFFGRQLRTDGEVFWLFLGVLGVILLLALWIETSALRRWTIAARDRRMVARSVGVPVVRVQVSLFVAGSAVGALAGALIAHWQGFTSSGSFGIELAIGLFLMLILGGAQSPWGPVLGAAFYVWMPKLLSQFERYQAIVYGTALLIVIMIAPNGLIGILTRRRSMPAALASLTTATRRALAREERMDA